MGEGMAGWMDGHMEAEGWRDGGMHGCMARGMME